MHSFIIVGTNPDLIDKKVNEILKKKKVKPLEFSLTKISDTRELNSFTRLTVDKATGIVIRGIDKATVETLNAFLKNLEEPQENIYYILTCSSIHNLLPTIVSRCQIINVSGKTKGHDQKLINNFISMSKAEKLNFLEKIRQRDEAINFVREVILGCHSQLHKTQKGYEGLANAIISANKTHTALLANGNVNLQLTNFILNLP